MYFEISKSGNNSKRSKILAICAISQKSLQMSVVLVGVRKENLLEKYCCCLDCYELLLFHQVLLHIRKISITLTYNSASNQSNKF